MNYPEKLEIKAHIRLILIISCSKKLQLLQRGFQRMLTLQPEAQKGRFSCALNIYAHTVENRLFSAKLRILF